MQSPATAAEGLSGLHFGAYPLPTFKFQPRSESVDWRRISALDVERVARELDVATLQENITGVTFCNLDREACSRCGQPVDPVLLKVLRLAQLTIEYLLHCQDCLSASVAQLEARLQASLGQQQRGQQELGRQADELKGVREESRRRRKMIGTLQQLLLQTGAHSYHTCHLCDKTFMNATFLRGHIQRRHAGVAEGGKQKQQEQPVEEILEELRAKLKWTQGELEAQREAERHRQLQDAEIARQKEIDAKKEFDEWKQKERAMLHEEIDKLKKLFWDEFKSVANHNSTLEEKLQALQSHSVVESNLGSLRDEESEEQLRQTQELQALKEKMEIQKTEWKRKMKELQGEHAAQKRELQEQNERLQASLSQDQRRAAAQAQRQISTLHAQLQEQARLITSQEKMIQTLSLRKEEGIRKGLKAMDTEEDSSEEEPEDSQDGQQKVLAALRRNPTLRRQFRPILEDTLEEKLESLGIKRDAKGISFQTLRHLESLLRAHREQKARRFSEFLSLREKLVKEATSRVTERQRHRAPASQPDSEAPVKSQQNPLAMQEAQTKPRTLQVALPSKPGEPPTTTLQSHSSHGPGLAQVPTPTPRPRARGPSGSPASPGPGPSTPPFSSEEDSEGNSVQRTSLQPPRGPSRMGPRPEDSWDWSDTETSEASAQPPDKGSGGLASSGTLVQSLVKNLEKQLEAPVKTPAGGVNLFFRPSAGPGKAAVPTRTPQLSDEDSDLEISSLEDLPQDLGQREEPKPLSRSKPPEKFGTSPWGPGRPRVPGW
ncbi:zinc finger protein DZIP1L isoform X2 [Suricata suricatta]|uniref:DAZ interacting zinc finger protein 1 like n=2 Tax=Suricata suricatta TaxID=37032 RepID=A0A673TXV2_SURSU|nr:zinc finger protein DZIP1L isoform X2 [Suricata suricatta]XP_029796069.1 zinc finger protein DZIP1L isoform X2 [Suricata suricatta]XP_029796070.1 zinc finger protein DZIP1L isoform X2 [Suricata suricatta]XP_029796071.1 zinc finger protein DZIP1L isoform X2 [Suricata suricatta]XP_029796072.1 zinc finger protein DZIP1L isoform X2 [Suricata suricatta]